MWVSHREKEVLELVCLKVENLKSEKEVERHGPYNRPGVYLETLVGGLSSPARNRALAACRQETHNGITSLHSSPPCLQLFSPLNSLLAKWEIISHCSASVESVLEHRVRGCYMTDCYCSALTRQYHPFKCPSKSLERTCMFNKTNICLCKLNKYSTLHNTLGGFEEYTHGKAYGHVTN